VALRLVEGEEGSWYRSSVYGELKAVWTAALQDIKSYKVKTDS
jgi:hypothetical protein